MVSSSSTGALKIYNAASPSCKEIIKVSRHPIQDFRRMTDAVYLLKLANGQIMQFNIRTRRTLFISEVGHTHQIQRAKINSQKSSLMATVGFDGTVRKWNTRTMKLESLFEDRQAKHNDKVV